MIEYRKGNLLNVANGVLVHGCNAYGVMGSGVALAVKEKYPKAFDVYKKYCNQYTDQSRHLSLGTITWYVDEHVVIANAITQKDFGRDPECRYVSYDAVDDVFKTVSVFAKTHNQKIHIPKIGAGLGNGDWSVISSIIESRCKGQTVICWEIV